MVFDAARLIRLVWIMPRDSKYDEARELGGRNEVEVLDGAFRV